MIVDLLRNDLGRLAEPGSVKVDRLFEIEDYPTVWQMVSEVSARIGRQGFEPVLRALFPCGSITGAPKIRAMQIIGALEGAPRRLYTGALGWLAPDGDFRLNVAIRTLELATGHRGKMGVGSGIVADSLSDAEWQECQLKAAFIRAGDPGLKLIETLRRENGVYPMWAGHLARLRRSAEWFGFRSMSSGFVRTGPAAGNRRLAHTPDLDSTGASTFRRRPWPMRRHRHGWPSWPTSASIAGSPARPQDDGPSLYDLALQGLPAESPVFDLVFLNERGEIAEGRVAMFSSSATACCLPRR
jgi:para-aminobenzoate synthetase/4-amino-4-deoxychorismate lyase